jgi:hypothetical protein
VIPPGIITYTSSSKKSPARTIRHHYRAPHRRWVIAFAGSVDIELGDGTRETFLPGDVSLHEV